MGIDPTNFTVPAGLFSPALPGEIPDAATDQEFARTEAALGVKLPAELLMILKVRNGGTIRLCSFRLKPTAAKVYGEKLYPLTRLAGVHPAHSNGLTQLTTLARTQWQLPEGLIPLDGDGHTWCCLDYRAGPQPTLTHIDLESPREVPIAGSFAQFIAGLFIDVTNLSPALIALDAGAPTGDDLAQVLAALGCAAHLYPGVTANPKFPLPPTWHWPAFRGLLKDTPVWIKFEHNKLYPASIQKTPDRAADHPMLTVAVHPADEDQCLSRLLAALGAHANPIHGVR